MRYFGIADALLSLRPNTEWILRGDEYEGIEWRTEGVTLPTEEELQVEIARLQAEYDADEYFRLRKEEYPDFRDYLDGVVKGDQAQIQAYIDSCLAVKAKYPKPE